MVYTPYNTSFRHSEEMELFEENERGVTKLLFLLSHHSQLKFDGRPRLNALIRELSQTFKVWYDAQTEISPKDREFWLSEEHLASCPNNPLAQEMRLMDRFWFLKTIRNHLEPRSEWPAADRPSKNADTRSQNRRTASSFVSYMSQWDCFLFVLFSRYFYNWYYAVSKNYNQARVLW